MINISGGIKYELIYDMMVTNEIDYYIMAKTLVSRKGSQFPSVTISIFMEAG